jgi:hypothetical protein
MFVRTEKRLKFKLYAMTQPLMTRKLRTEGDHEGKAKRDCTLNHVSARPRDHHRGELTLRSMVLHFSDAIIFISEALIMSTALPHAKVKLLDSRRLL